MEASSHGLDQRRMDAVQLAAAAFTNFTQDHLDYHGTMEAYFAAKARLFTDLLPAESTAVINLDDPKGAELAAICEAREIEVITVAQYAEDARLRITGRRMDETGQDVLFRWQGESHQARLDLIGGFQAMNALTAAGLVIGAGEAAEAVFAALPRIRGVRGRMQLAARRENGAPVYVRLLAHARFRGNRAEGAAPACAGPACRRAGRGRRPRPRQAAADGAGGGGTPTCVRHR